MVVVLIRTALSLLTGKGWLVPLIALLLGAWLPTQYFKPKVDNCQALETRNEVLEAQAFTEAEKRNAGLRKQNQLMREHLVQMEKENQAAFRAELAAEESNRELQERLNETLNRQPACEDMPPSCFTRGLDELRATTKGSGG